MPHQSLLDPERTALAVIDIQEAFRSVIPDFETLAVRASVAVQGFQILGLPVLVTEQYPAGLGPTAEEIRMVLPPGFETYEKTAFSSCGSSAFVDRLSELDVRQVVVCGLETHICVNQTVHDLIYRGFQVHLLCDCVSSRFEYNRLAGLAKMARSGAIESSIEMALFELMRDSKHGQFKEIQSLIK